MSLSVLILVFVTVQRLAEMAWARANERRLRGTGAIEIGAGHYPLIVALHAAWIAWMWLKGWERPLDLPLAAVFLLLQAARVWVLASLGRRWTTRVMIVPGETLVRSGPFALIRHPNYTVVALEIVVLPLALGLWGAAIGFGVLNLAILAWRIRVEDQGLAPARRQPTVG